MTQTEFNFDNSPEGSLLSLPNLRHVILGVYLGKTCTDLVDPQNLRNNVNIYIASATLMGTRLKSSPRDAIPSMALRYFLEDRGQQVKVLLVKVVDEAKELVDILLNANLQLDKCDITFKGHCEWKLTTDDVKSLYSLRVHRYLRLTGESPYLKEGLVEIFNSRPVVNKNCRIITKQYLK